MHEQRLNDPLRRDARSIRVAPPRDARARVRGIARPPPAALLALPIRTGPQQRMGHQEAAAPETKGDAG